MIAGVGDHPGEQGPAVVVGGDGDPDRIAVVPWSVPLVAAPAPGAGTEVRRRHGLGDRRFVLYPAIAYLHKNHAVLLAAVWGSAFADVGDYSSLYLWLRADQGVQTSGNTVTKWVDQSANGFEFVLNPSGALFLAGNDPEGVPGALNGLPVVRFDGGDKLSSVANLQLFSTSSSPLSVFAVFKSTNNPQTALKGCNYVKEFYRLWFNTLFQ